MLHVCWCLSGCSFLLHTVYLQYDCLLDHLGFKPYVQPYTFMSDLQHALGWFAVECEAAKMRASTSKSEAVGVSSHPSESLSISEFCSQVRVKWSVRLTGGLVQSQQ